MTLTGDILGSETTVRETRLFGKGPQGHLPLTADDCAKNRAAICLA